jgi:hypothetical protein
MAQKTSQGEHGGFPGPKAENRLADDWPVYVAFLPGVVIGVAAAIMFTAAASWQERGASSAASLTSPGDADDYVKGLAKLGIARIPGYEPLPTRDSSPGGGPVPVTQLTRACA